MRKQSSTRPLLITFVDKYCPWAIAAVKTKNNNYRKSQRYYIKQCLWKQKQHRWRSLPLGARNVNLGFLWLHIKMQIKFTEVHLWEFLKLSQTIYTHLHMLFFTLFFFFLLNSFTCRYSCICCTFSYLMWFLCWFSSFIYFPHFITFSHGAVAAAVLTVAVRL